MTQNTSHAVMQQRHEAHDSPPIVSRQEAMALGQLWYFTGRPCPRGHLGKRNCSNHECRSCVDVRRKEQRAIDPTKQRAKEKRKYHRDPEKHRERNREQRNKHIKKRREYDRQRYRDPARQTWQKQQAVGWGRKNKGKRNFIIARRRSGIEQATPKWLTEEQHAEIRAFYIRAKEMGEGYQVDHIIPLRGRSVSGLHVPWNLQILTKAQNIAKGNSYEA